MSRAVTLSFLIGLLLLILRDKTAKDLKSLLGILIIPGFQPERVQKVRPAVVCLHDFPFSGGKWGLCGGAVSKKGCFIVGRISYAGSRCFEACCLFDASSGDELGFFLFGD